MHGKPRFAFPLLARARRRRGSLSPTAARVGTRTWPRSEKAPAPPASSSAERGGVPRLGTRKALSAPPTTTSARGRRWPRASARTAGVVHANVRVGADASGARGLIAIGPIAEGATLFRIPETCTLTAASALRSPLGKAIAARAEAAVEDGTGYRALAVASSGRHRVGGVRRRRQRRSVLALRGVPRAASLAAGRRAGVVAARAEGNVVAFACANVRQLVNALRSRRARVDRLGGSRKDAEDAFEALVRVALVEHVRDRFQNPRRDDPKKVGRPFPDTSDAWDAFRRALAAVHSRDLTSGGRRSGDARRERRERANAFARRPGELPGRCPRSPGARSRRVRARPAAGLRESQAVEKPPTSSRVRVETPKRFNEDGGDVREVEVVALRAFVSGDPVRVAYGARSNEHLLTRYGFCVRDNVEPDGSSNDETPFSFRKPGAWRFRGRRDFPISRSRLLRARRREAKRFPSRRATGRVHVRALRGRAGPVRRARAGTARRRGRGRRRRPLSRGNRSSRGDARAARSRRGGLPRAFVDGDGDDDDACAALMYGSGRSPGRRPGRRGKSTPRRGAKRKRGRRGPRGPRGFARRASESPATGRGRAPARGGCDRAVRPVGARAEACVVYFESESADVPTFPRGRHARRARGRRRITEEGTETRPAATKTTKVRVARQDRRRVRGAQAEERAFESAP